MNQGKVQTRTKGAIISSSILHEPFSALFPLLPFILLKEMHASALHITILAMLKPSMGLVSFFYSTFLMKLNCSLKTSLLMTGFFARAPFLIALFFNEPWVYIFACAMYMLFSRASISPWMELLRLNLPQKVLQKFFSFGSKLSYGIGIILTFLLAVLLERHEGLWRLVFALFLCIGLMAVILQALLPKIEKNYILRPTLEVKPFKEMISLLKTRPDFVRFQYIFMAGGFGLMVLSPALPSYFCDHLKINYKDLLLIFSVCRAIGFILTTSFWTEFLSKDTINVFLRCILFGFLFYALLLFLAKNYVPFIFIAYIVYGAFQAASHLVWHLSGPLFSFQENSSSFTCINVLTAGLRGCFAPLLGSYLYLLYGFYGVFLVSSCCFLLGIVLTQMVKIRVKNVIS